MSHYDLYAIGNALVDSEYEVSDALLQKMGISKRHMTLIHTHTCIRGTNRKLHGLGDTRC